MRQDLTPVEANHIMRVVGAATDATDGCLPSCTDMGIS